MKLGEDIKNKINEEYKIFESEFYGNKTREERKALGAFFTPPVLTIQMIEKLSTLDDDILDPTCGAGGLLAACVIAGADPKRCYGIEIDPDILTLCRKRLGLLGVPEENLILGDATDPLTYLRFR